MDQHSHPSQLLKAPDLKRSAELSETSNDDRDSSSLPSDPKPPLSKDRLAEAYISETKKIDLWTYLFRQLANATEQLYGMCEIERRPEFCRGVLEAVRAAHEEFTQLENLLAIEQKQPPAPRPSAWNLKRPQAPSFSLETLKESENQRPRPGPPDPRDKAAIIPKSSPLLEQAKNARPPISEFGALENSGERRAEPNPDEKYEGVFDANALVEFKLLSELVLDGRMAFYDAVVLLIRERAAFLGDLSAKRSPAARKTSAEDSEELPGPAPINMGRLARRLQTKLRLGEADLEKDSPREVLELRYRQKLSSADSRRSQLRDKRLEASGRALGRVEQVRGRQEREQQLRLEGMERKEREFFQRRMLKLDLIRQRAKENRMKASEISFLLLLEKNAKRMNLDIKLEETRKRRIKIIEKIAERQRQTENLISTAKTRRELLAAEKVSLITKKLQRIEEAGQRRKHLLEEKARKTSAKNLDESFNSKNSEPHPSILQNQKFVLLYLFDEKEKLDAVFKRHKILQGGELPLNFSALGRSLSLNFPQRHVNELNSITPENSFDLEGNSKKKKRHKRKRKAKPKNQNEITDSPDLLNKNQLSDSERNDWTDSVIKSSRTNLVDQKASRQKKQLASYYKFLTSDVELAEKVRRLKAKNLQLLQRKSFANLNAHIFSDQISEMPEFFCRELAREEIPNKILPSQKLFCTFCDVVLKIEETVDQHLLSKLHKKTKIHYGFTFSEDASAVIVLNEKDLSSERLLFLRKKCKKIKQQLTLRALKHESSYNAKEIYASANKTRLQKLALEFEKMLQGPKKDYESIRMILGDLWKILEKNVENDLHVLRQVRFINSFIDFFKSASVSLKFEMPSLIEIFNDHFKIFARLMLLRENRNFLLATNRALPLVDLLIWSWTQSLRHLQCLDYIPQIMHIITLLLKSKLAEDKLVFKSSLIEYICFSGFLSKIKNKFVTLNDSAEPPDSAIRTGNVLLKTLNFLETLTFCLENQRGFVFTENTQVSHSVIFVVRESEICGCLQLLASLLLSKGQYKKSGQGLGQNLVVQSFLILKILNNFARSSVADLQHVLGGAGFNSEQFYHILVFLFDFCTLNFSPVGEVFELLQQLILLTGYFALKNPKNQNLLSRGTETHTIIYKLANLPYQFYFGEFVFKDLLFPTLLALIYKNARSTQILLSEVNRSILLDYIKESKAMYKDYDASQNAELIAKYRAKMEKEQCSLSSNSNAVTSVQNCFHILPFRFSIADLDEAYLFIQNFSFESQSFSEIVQ